MYPGTEIYFVLAYSRIQDDPAIWGLTKKNGSTHLITSVTHMIHQRTVAGSNPDTHSGVDFLVQFAQNISKGKHGSDDDCFLF